MFIRSRSKHVTNRVRPIVRLCVCEATERSESFWVLKCGKAAQFLPWWEWGETDLPGTSVFGNGCGTCSPKRRLPCASER